MDKNNQPQKLSVQNLAALFEPKKNQGNKKEEKPKEMLKMKKINNQELIDKMKNDYMKNDQDPKNQALKQHMNMVNNSNMFAIINKINKQQQELKENKINDLKNEAERKEKAKITSAKIMEKQRAKLIADREKKAKEDEEKRKQEEEKIKKEKEFKEQNDKARSSLNLNENRLVDYNNYSRNQFANFNFKSEDRGSISEGQEVNILMDLSSRKGSIVISGFKEEMITSQFPNCILYQNNSQMKHKIFDDNFTKNFSSIE